MKVHKGKPEQEGWHFNVIHRTGQFDNNPDNFIGLWTDYYDKKTNSWLINPGHDDFWLELPEIRIDDNELLLKNENELSVKLTINPGVPNEPGCYIIVLEPEANLFYFFDRKLKIDKSILKNLLNNIGAVLQSDRFNPNSYFCDDLDSLIGWVEFPVLTFPDGTIINFNK